MHLRTLLPFLLAAVALAQQPETIALNSLASSGISQSEAFALTNALRTELGKTGKFRVMERAQMDQILVEQGFQASGACDEASCAMEIGQLLAVKYVVVGSIGQVGKTYTLNIRLVEVGSGEIARDISENYKGATDGLLTDVVPLAAQKLAGTYQAKSKTPIFIAAGSAVAVGIAVPVILLTTKNEEDPDPSTQSNTNLKVQW